MAAAVYGDRAWHIGHGEHRGEILEDEDSLWRHRDQGKVVDGCGYIGEPVEGKRKVEHTDPHERGQIAKSLSRCTRSGSMQRLTDPLARFDPLTAIDFLKLIDRALGKLDIEEIREAQANHDSLAALKLAQKALFSSY